MSVILVTGARGNIGSRVVARLVEGGARVRALVRRPAEAGLPPAVEVVPGTYEDASALKAAMDGVQAALFVTAGPALATQDGHLSAAARASGVERIVKVSILHAGHGGPELRSWHRQGEEQIEAAGLKWTFLRPGPFASNALRWVPTLRTAGKAFGAFGAAALPMIHPEDIAEIATLALTTRDHEGQAYDLTGPEALTASDQVAALARATGKPFQYVNVPDETALRGMLDAGMPPVYAEAMLHLTQAVRSSPPPASDIVQKILGRPARTYQQWVNENATAFH